MLKNISKLNLVRVGSYITYSSLTEIGNGLLESFRGIIGEISLPLIGRMYGATAKQGLFVWRDD